MDIKANRKEIYRILMDRQLPLVMKLDFLDSWGVVIADESGKVIVRSGEVVESTHRSGEDIDYRDYRRVYSLKEE